MKYNEYKLSGTQWVNSIPVTWECKKISSLFTQRKAKVSDTEYPPLSVTKTGIVPQLDTAAKTDDGDNRKFVCSGDFVINSRSDRKGSCGVSDLDGSVSLINIVLTPRQSWNNRYVHYLLRSQPFSEEYYRHGRGIVADLWTTRYSEMKSIMLPIPPLEEQDQIVRYLDWQVSKINKLIAVKKKQMKLLKGRRKKQINAIVLHGLRNEELVDSGVRWIGSIPKNWQVTTLRRCASVRSGITLGKTYPAGTVLVQMPYLRVANVQDGYVDVSNVAEISVTPEEAEKYQLPTGCVLMTEGGDRDKLGRGCVWEGQITPCVHQNHVFAVAVNPVLLSNYYLEYVSTSDIGRVYFDITAIKTTNLACTNSTKVRAFPIPLPPMDEQNEIVTALKASGIQHEHMLETINRYITTLLDLRTRLISDVVTGQIDVRGIEVPEFDYVEETDTNENPLDDEDVTEETVEQEE